MMPQLPKVLTIAGSDSGGSAGIQADLKTFEARGVFGTTALTIITAQDTHRVHQAQPIPETMIQAQIEAVLRDIGADAVKTGLLGRASVVQLVAHLLREYQIKKLVVDPVLVNGQGQLFVSPETIVAYQQILFPLATVITPNTDEAALLAGIPVQKSADLHEAAQRIYQGGAVVVKGGQLAGAIINVFYDGQQMIELTAPRLPIENPHGVGCTFAAAIAAELAKGQSPLEAVGIAHEYLHQALAASQKVGSGRVPVFHAVGRPPLTFTNRFSSE